MEGLLLFNRQLVSKVQQVTTKNICCSYMSLRFSILSILLWWCLNSYLENWRGKKNVKTFSNFSGMSFLPSLKIGDFHCERSTRLYDISTFAFHSGRPFLMLSRRKDYCSESGIHDIFTF